MDGIGVNSMVRLGVFFREINQISAKSNMMGWEPWFPGCRGELLGPIAAWLAYGEEEEKKE